MSATPGSSASFVFSGSAVRWIGQSGPDRAIAQVSIGDGVDQGPVDTYAPTRTDQKVLFSAVGLGAGDHTITITWAGKNAASTASSYLVIDAIDAPGAPEPARR